jgi:hypothetical protein
MNKPELTRKSFVCHYTSVASHAFMKRYRYQEGFDFSPPPAAAPQIIEMLPLPHRILARAKKKLRQALGD